MRKISIATLVLLAAGCGSNGPAEQCLASFAKDLKDPESGKIISFEGNVLTYTATNSYGARTQGKALCKKTSNGYERDRHAEYLAVLTRSSEKLEKYTACKKSGGSKEECAMGSTALSLSSPSSSTDSLVNAVTRETQAELGF